MALDILHYRTLSMFSYVSTQLDSSETQRSDGTHCVHEKVRSRRRWSRSLIRRLSSHTAASQESAVRSSQSEMALRCWIRIDMGVPHRHSWQRWVQVHYRCYRYTLQVSVMDRFTRFESEVFVENIASEWHCLVESGYPWKSLLIIVASCLFTGERSRKLKKMLLCNWIKQFSAIEN